MGPRVFYLQVKVPKENVLEGVVQVEDTRFRSGSDSVGHV